MTWMQYLRVLPDIIGDYPNLKEIFSDIIDKDFEYGGKQKYILQILKHHGKPI